MQQHVQIDSLAVCFERQGHGHAMVLVHGLLGYSFSWRHVLPSLSREREVFAVDMPASGFSECSPTMDASLQGAAGRLLKFLDSQGIQSCDLVGSSYGGTTALYLSLKHPNRVRTLTLVSPANPWSRIGRKRLLLLNVPPIARAFPCVGRTVRPLHRISVRRMYGDASRLTPDTLRGYSLPLMRRGVFEHAVRIAHNWRADMVDLKAALSAAPTVPTLIIWGSKDRLVELSSAKILASHLKESRVVVMDGAGHLPYEECPDEFASILVRFLANQASGRDGK